MHGFMKLQLFHGLVAHAHVCINYIRTLYRLFEVVSFKGSENMRRKKEEKKAEDIY